VCKGIEIRELVLCFVTAESHETMADSFWISVPQGSDPRFSQEQRQYTNWQDLIIAWNCRE